jgi:hypothetical protein
MSSRDTVDLGKCYVGDSLSTDFIFKNEGTIMLSSGYKEPSFIIYRASDRSDDIDFEEFKNTTQLPLFINQNNSDILTMKYFASANLPVYPPGKKYAKLKLSMFDASINPDTLKESSLIAVKIFNLVARKTIHAIDANEDLFSFDSVYIHPVDTMKMSVIYKNYSGTIQTAEAQDFQMQTPIPFGQELTLFSPILPLVLQPKTSSIWTLSYYPVDLTLDSATFKLFYHPAPNKPDTSVISIRGQGVIQSLVIDKLDSDSLTSDTLDFGEVRLNKIKECKLVLNNTGNIPFGSKNQYILDGESELISDYFSISKTLDTFSNLYPHATDSLKVTFFPLIRGKFTGRVVIESDLEGRRIYGYPKSALKIIYPVKGVAIEPVASIGKDTIDMGNVVIRPECSNIRDTLFPITNLGNTVLKIISASLTPEPPASMFRIVNFPETIIPGETAFIHLNFSSSSVEEETSFLTLVTNGIPPLDTIIIYLKATGVPPLDVNISLPVNMRSKPGRKISAPIFVEKEKMIYVRNFNDTLTYDRTTLRYVNNEVIHTASEGAPVVNIVEVPEGGRLSISLAMSDDSYFLQRDTLVILNFNTFLGESDSTSIAFADPKFGDGHCDRVLTPTKTNGLYKLDSVCGLEFKTGKLPTGITQLISFTQNDNQNSVDIGLELGTEGMVRINFYDLYGNNVGTSVEEYLQMGLHDFNLTTGNLFGGLYFCKIQFGNRFEVRKLIIQN